MRDNARHSGDGKTLSPAKAGRIFGKIKVSQLGAIRVKTADGKTKIVKANRMERRHGIRPD